MASSSLPRIGNQLVRHGGKEYMAIKEGLAHILTPPNQETPTKPPKAGGEDSPSVFYNPIQQFNRDLSVLAIRAYGDHVRATRAQNAERRRKIELAKGKKRKRDEGEGKIENGNSTDQNNEGNGNENANANANAATGDHSEQPPLTILDALSATGLRALRYGAELPSPTHIVANDLSHSAIQSMKTNIEYNELDKTIRPNHADARAYMYSQIDQPGNARSKKFDVVDLDPYGTAAPFMDAAVQAVKNGGLLCVTCTDAGVWASTGYPEKTFALYGGAPCKGAHSHEAGLRLILHGLAASAARYGSSIEPLLSLSIDFYARVFVRVHNSPTEAKYLAANTMLVYNCDSGCGAWSTQRLAQTKEKLNKKGEPFHNFGLARGPSSGPSCEHCGFKTHIGGPMWAGPLHNNHFIQAILNLLPGLDKNTYQTVNRIEGMLTTAAEEDLDTLVPTKEPTPPPGNNTSGKETEQDQDQEQEPVSPSIIPRTDPGLHDPHPFYFVLSNLSKVLQSPTMPLDAFRGALRHLGYRCTRSHAKPNTIRTDAPWDVIWEITREWIRQRSHVKPTSLSPSSAGAAIMAKSRENIQKSNNTTTAAENQNSALDVLKNDVVSATEDVPSLHELVTRIQAALYRSGATANAAASAKKSVPNQSPSGQENQHPTPSTQPPAAAKPHPSTLDIVFDEALGRKETHRRRRLVRYQINPRANWGPLSRASGSRK